MSSITESAVGASGHWALRETLGTAAHLGALSSFYRSEDRDHADALAVNRLNRLLLHVADLPPQFLDLLAENIDNLHEVLHRSRDV